MTDEKRKGVAVEDISEQLDEHDKDMCARGLQHKPWCVSARREANRLQRATRRDSTGVTSDAYRDGFDQIDWTKRGPAS